MPNQCPACNTQNIDGARFCRHCGRTLSLPPASVFTGTPEGTGVSAAPSYGGLYAPEYTNIAPGRLAGFWIRFAAFIIDSVLISIVMLPGNFIAAITSDSNSDEVGAVAMVLGVLGAFAFWLFNVYLLGRDGATLGKKAVGLKVLDQSGQPLGFGRAFLRELCKSTISSWVCYLGFLWMLWDDRKQTWHDKIMDSNVYYKA